MNLYQFLFDNQIKSSFLRSFVLTLITALTVFSFVAAPILVYQNVALKRQIIDLEVQVEADSIFQYSLFKTEEGKDTILPVMKQGVVDAIINLNKAQPAHQELVYFANWAIPLLNYYAEENDPVDPDGILIGTWNDWKEDQKALAAEKKQQGRN